MLTTRIGLLVGAMTDRKRFLSAVFAILVAACSTLPASGEESFRTWSDRSGKHSLEGQFDRIEGGKVYLKTRSGQTKKIPLDRLSGSDKAYALKASASQSGTDNPFTDVDEDNPFVDVDQASSVAGKNGPDGTSGVKAGKTIDPSGKYVDLVFFKPEYQSLLINDPFLLGGGVGVKDLPDVGEVLIAVGKVPNMARAEIDSVKRAKSQVETERNGKRRADAEMAYFLRTDITAETKHQRIVTSQKMQTAQGAKRKRRVEKVLDDLIRVKATEILQRIPTMGHWYSADRQFYFVAVFVKLGS